MFCKECGEIIEDTVKFCSKCGARQIRKKELEPTVVDVPLGKNENMEIVSRLYGLENTIAQFEDVIGIDADDLRKEFAINSTIMGFFAKLVEEINTKIVRVINTDISKVKEMKKRNETFFSKCTEAIDSTYENCVNDFISTVRKIITEESNSLFEKAKKANASAEGSITRTRYWTTGILFWKKEHERDYKVRTLQTGVVKSTLNDLVADLQDLLSNSVEEEIQNWKKSVRNRVTGVLTSAVDDVDLIDFDMLKTALRRLVNNMELPDLDLGSNIFSSSYSGTIEDNDIDRFADEVLAYMSKLRNIFDKASDEYISKAEQSAKREKMSEMFFSDIKKRLDYFEKEIENKELTLDRLKKCSSALEKAA